MTERSEVFIISPTRPRTAPKTITEPLRPNTVFENIEDGYFIRVIDTLPDSYSVQFLYLCEDPREVVECAIGVFEYGQPMPFMSVTNLFVSTEEDVVYGVADIQERMMTFMDAVSVGPNTNVPRFTERKYGTDIRPMRWREYWTPETLSCWFHGKVETVKRIFRPGPVFTPVRYSGSLPPLHAPDRAG